MPKPAYSRISISQLKEQLEFTIPHNKGEIGDINNGVFIFYLSLLLGATLLPSANTAQELPLAEALIVHVAVTTPIAISLSYFLF